MWYPLHLDKYLLKKLLVNTDKCITKIKYYFLYVCHFVYAFGTKLPKIIKIEVLLISVLERWNIGVFDYAFYLAQLKSWKLYMK